MKVVSKVKAMELVGAGEVDKVFVADMNRPLGGKHFICMYPLKYVTFNEITETESRRLVFFVDDEAPTEET